MPDRPRQISAEMVDAMRKAAGRVWRKHRDEVPEEHQEQWRQLCWRHVTNHFAKLESK